MFFGYIFLDFINTQLQDEHLLVPVFFICNAFAKDIFMILITFKHVWFSIPLSNKSDFLLIRAHNEDINDNVAIILLMMTMLLTQYSIDDSIVVRFFFDSITRVTTSTVPTDIPSVDPGTDPILSTLLHHGIRQLQLQKKIPAFLKDFLKMHQWESWWTNFIQDVDHLLFPMLLQTYYSDVCTFLLFLSCSKSHPLPSYNQPTFFSCRESFILSLYYIFQFKLLSFISSWL